MDTIELINAEGNKIVYTAAELTAIISKGVTSATNTVNLRGKLEETKYKVHNFFKNLEWKDGEATVDRGEVNELLDFIGCDILTTKFNATVTITTLVKGYAAKDEDDLRECIDNDIDVYIGSNAIIKIDEIVVDDIEESE